jgi:nicotinate-nucleotide adenylyltransferase
MTAIFGGAFDPPHNGHVAFVEAAEREFGEPLVILVVEDPGHKAVETDAATRLELARLAFPGRRVELDPHGRTVDMLRERRFDDPLFLIGADQFAALSTWKEPEQVLRLTRLGVATRPGYPREPHEDGRVVFFDVEPVPVSSSDIRGRVARGESIDGLVPQAVAEAITRLGLYRSGIYTRHEDSRRN